MNSTQLALSDVRGLLNDLMLKLSAEDGSEWLTALNKMLRKENPWPVSDAARKVAVPVVREQTEMILAIDRAKPFNPGLFIGSGVKIWKGAADENGLKGEEQQDARSLALAKIDFAKAARFETCLIGKETVITGENRLLRLCEREKEFIRPDAKIGQTLYEEPGQKTLRWLDEKYGVTWFELPGTELRSSRGHRYFLCLCRRVVGSWDWDDHWLGGDRGAGGPALVLAVSDLVA